MSTYSVEAVLKATGADQFSRAFQNAAKSAERLQAISGKMKSIGSTMTKAVTLPITGMGVAIAKTGAKFDDQMSTVQAVSSATGKEMNQLRDQAKEMGRTTRFSASEAGEGMEMLARAGFSTTEVMDSLPSVLDLAAAGAVDLGDAADITSNILSGFGLEATETARVADILAQASSDSNTDVQGLGEAFKYVGPVASDAGLSLEDTAAAIGILGDAGIQGGQAGNMLKRGLLNMSDSASPAAKKMEELGIEVFDANGNMKSMPEVISELEGGLEGMTAKQKTAALTTIFGSEAVAGWSALINAGSDELGTFSSELENSEGAASEMAGVMEDNLAGSFRSLMSALEGLAISFYEMGEGPMRNLVEWTTNLVRKFTELDDSTKQIIIIMAGVAAAIGPVLIALSLLIDSVKNVGTTIGALSKAFSVTSLSMFAWIAVIGLVAVAIFELWQTNEEFRNNVTIIWNSIKQIITSVFQAIQPVIMIFIASLGMIVQALMPVIAWVVNVAATFLNWVADIIQTHTWIMTLIQVIAVVVGVIAGLIAVVTVVAKVFAIVATVIKVVGAVMAFLMSPIGLVIAGVGLLIGIFVGLWNVLQWLGEKFEWLGSLLDTVSSFMSNAWNKFLGFFGKGTEEASEQASDSIEGVSEKGKEDLGGLSESGIESTSALSEGVTTNMSDMNLNASEQLESMKTSGIDDMANLKENMLSDSSDMNANVTDDISNMSLDSINSLDDLEKSGNIDMSSLNTGVSSEVSDMSSDVKSKVGDMETSASGDFSGLNKSMSKNAKEIKTSVSKSFSGMSKAIKKEISNMQRMASSGMKGIAIDIGQSMVHSINAMETSLNRMSTIMNNSMDKMSNTAKKGMNKVTKSVKQGTDKINKTTRSGLIKTIQHYVTSFNGINVAVKNGMSKAVYTVKSSNNRIASSTRSLSGRLRSAGLFAMAGLRNGLNAGAGSVYSTANRIANNVARTIRRALKIKSPSRVLMEIGNYTGEGLAVGIESMSRMVQRASESLAEHAIPDIKRNELSNQVMQANRQLERQFTNEISSNVRVEKQPAKINLVLGGTEFNAFVEDITDTQERTKRIRKRFR